MSILRKLALAMLMVFGLTLVAPAPAAASGADDKDKQGDIKVCKVLKDAKNLKDGAAFDFVIREKKKEGGKDRYKFDIAFYKGEEGTKKCEKFTVDKGAHVVREKSLPNGFKLRDIDVKGCYYKDRNDKDAKVEVDVVDKGKCTVTFTNKKDGRKDGR
jgi:hypothetical protein